MAAAAQWNDQTTLDSGMALTSEMNISVGELLQQGLPYHQPYKFRLNHYKDGNEDANQEDFLLQEREKNMSKPV